MFWYVLSAVVFLGALSLLIYTRIRDRRYAKSRIFETMSPALRDEVKTEEDEAHRRQEKFKLALDDASKAGRDK